MYNWFFFKIYYFYKSKNNHDPIFNTSILVFFAQGLHFFVILSALQYFLDFDIPTFSSDNSKNKAVFIPIGLIWLILVYFFYRKNVKSLGVKYNSRPLKLYELLKLLFIIIVIPLYLCIRLSGGQVWK